MQNKFSVKVGILSQGGWGGSDPIPTFIKHCFHGIFDPFLPKISEKFTEKIPTFGEGGGVKPVGPKSQLLPKICFACFPNSSYGLNTSVTLAMFVWMSHVSFHQNGHRSVSMLWSLLLVSLCLVNVNISAHWCVINHRLKKFIIQKISMQILAMPVNDCS